MQIDWPANTRNGQRGISGAAALHLRLGSALRLSSGLICRAHMNRKRARKQAGGESDRLPRLGRERTGELDRVEAS